MSITVLLNMKAVELSSRGAPVGAETSTWQPTQTPKRLWSLAALISCTFHKYCSRTSCELMKSGILASWWRGEFSGGCACSPIPCLWTSWFDWWLEAAKLTRHHCELTYGRNWVSHIHRTWDKRCGDDLPVRVHNAPALVLLEHLNTSQQVTPMQFRRTKNIQKTTPCDKGMIIIISLYHKS